MRIKPFSERNPIIIAVVGLVLLIVIGLGTFFSADLPVIGAGPTYAANFTDASGLKAGDDVRIAGVKVGTVRAIKLQGTHVQVTFRSKGAWIGDDSSAAIKIKTLLGQEYIDLQPAGNGPLQTTTPIPTPRTTTPLDVQAALNQLSSTVGDIDTTQLAKSFTTLSQAFKDTPKAVRTSLTGLAALSKTIASRDAELSKLAQNTNQLTGSLASTNKQFSALINDGAALLGELQQRSTAITQLLAGTTQLSRQLAGFVNDNEQTLRPALAQLTRVTNILNANQGNLQRALRLIGPYYSVLSNATGNGPWIDIYICGLFDRSNAPIIDADARRTCDPKAGS